MSSNVALNEILFELLKESNNFESEVRTDLNIWEDVETVHHDIWERELREHKEKTAEMILYKEASLKTSHTARMSTLQEQLQGSKDKNYRIMTEGKIRIAMEDYELHMEQLQQARDKADILFELLAYGMLIVESETEE